MQALSRLIKITGLLGLIASLGISPVFAQHAGDNWTYGEDLNSGQLVLRYEIGASEPASIWCFRDRGTIELNLMLPAQNIAVGQLINAQVVMDTKPFQLSTSSTVAKDGMLKATFSLPTNGDFMNNAIASTQMQFGIPGQQYQTVYFPPSKQDFANFNGKCQWMLNEAKAQTSQQQVQQTNQEQQAGAVKEFPGGNGWNSRVLRKPNNPNKAINAEFYLDGGDGSRQFTGYCEPNSRFDLYVTDPTRTVPNGSVTVEFISGNQRIAMDGHMQSAGTDKPEIYMQGNSPDMWKMLVKDFFAYHASTSAGQPHTPISVVANGRQIYTMPHVNPFMILASLSACELPKDQLESLHALIRANIQDHKNQQVQQTQQTQTANAGAQGQQAVSWKLHPGTGRNAQFHITNPNDGNQIVMFCTPQNPNIIHAYIKHGKAYTEQRQITLNSVGYVTLKMYHNITGTTTNNGIYLALKHDDPHWGVIGNASTYSVNGTQIASFPINAFGTSFYDELNEFRRQCGTTQAHKDSISAAMKPHADKALKAAQNGQEAFIDLNAVSVGQSRNPQASAQQQQITQQQPQQNNSGSGQDTVQQGLNKLGQVLQLGQKIVDLKNQLQGNSGNTNQQPQQQPLQQQQVQQPQVGSGNTGQQLPTLQQQRPVQQAPANQQTTYSNLVNYGCENGAHFQVRYEGGNGFDRAVLIMAGIQPLPLPIAESGSGTRYTNGPIEWLTKGPDGILRQNGQELVCEERQ